MAALVSRIRILAVTGLLLLAVWLGLKEGLDGVRGAESMGQRIAAVLQVGYGAAAVASLLALFTHRPWLRWAVWIWVVTITATGGLAPVVWGGAGWSAAVSGGGVTALVAGGVAWGALLHARAASGSAPGRPPQEASGG